MNRKYILGCICISLCASLSAGRKLSSVDKFRNVEIMEISMQGIKIMYNGGVCTLTAEKLSEKGKIQLKNELLEVQELREKYRKRKETPTEKQSSSTEEKKAEKIEWTVIKNKEELMECTYSSGKIKLEALFFKSDGEIISFFIKWTDNGYTLWKALKEFDGRFKTMKEINQFLIIHHEKFLNPKSEADLVDFIKENCPPKKKITFD